MKSLLFSLLLLFLISPLKAFNESQNLYSHIRPELLLPHNAPLRVTDMAQLKHLSLFQKLIRGKITAYCSSCLFYAYASESVDDTSWGCAWRAIQTSLSSLYRDKGWPIPSFKELYETYGSREFILTTAKKHHIPIANTTDWMAPHEEWHMWGDPFIAFMIFLNHWPSSSRLVNIHGFVKSFSPAFTQSTLDFFEFKKLLKAHYKKSISSRAFVIDNGRYALNILGFGENKNTQQLFLLIGDPHLKRERLHHPLNGIYLVEFDSKGRQVSLNYPMMKNHYDHESYQSLNFEPSTNWSLAIP